MLVRSEYIYCIVLCSVVLNCIVLYCIKLYRFVLSNNVVNPLIVFSLFIHIATRWLLQTRRQPIYPHHLYVRAGIYLHKSAHLPIEGARTAHTACTVMGVSCMDLLMRLGPFLPQLLILLVRTYVIMLLYVHSWQWCCTYIRDSGIVYCTCWWMAFFM